MEISTGAIIFGIAVALIVMWLSLRKYEGCFDDKTMFKSLIIGFFTGFLAFLIESFRFDIVFLLISPLIEQLIKLIGINLPSYHNRRETIIYGLVLGLGFGSIYMPLKMFQALRDLHISLSLLLGSSALSIGYILFHGGTGCMLGYGVFKSQRWKYLIYVTLLGFPLPLVEMYTYYLAKMNMPHFGDMLVTIIGILEIIYCAVVFLIVCKKILPYALPRKKRKELL